MFCANYFHWYFFFLANRVCLFFESLTLEKKERYRASPVQRYSWLFRGIHVPMCYIIYIEV